MRARFLRVRMSFPENRFPLFRDMRKTNQARQRRAVMAKSARENSLAAVSGTIVLVGAGKMGGALLDGWLARKLNPKKVVVLEPQPSKAIKALARRGVRLNPKGTIGPVAALVIAVKQQSATQA